MSGTISMLFARLLGRTFLGTGLRAEVENCIHNAGLLIAARLFRKYTPQHGEQMAALLASAVANELFGAEPGNEAGRQFLARNKELVETHLRAVSSETRICQMVSVLAHTKLNVAAGTGTVTPQIIQWCNKLTDLGILLPIGRVTLPSSPEEMRQQVREFELWSLHNRNEPHYTSHQLDENRQT